MRLVVKQFVSCIMYYVSSLGTKHKIQCTAFLLVTCYLLPVTCNAQDTKTDANTLQDEASKLKAVVDTSAKHWKHGGIISFSGQEVSLTNWAAGGQGAI